MRIRRRSFLKGMAGVSAGLLLPTHRVLGANERVNVAVAGINSQGKGHIKAFHNLENVNVIAICDPDSEVLNKCAEYAPGARLIRDYRKVLEMKDLDALVIATPNHWHSPMTIAACQAGKHVYVEKPVSHCIWEGRQMCDARKKYKRVVQAGTQQLSCPAPTECGEDIRSGKYGKVKWVHCFKMHDRPSNGKRDKPMVIPDNIDYNLWAGPAPMDPVYRDNFHYDWHWDLRWGDGEMGNWAVHYTSDICFMLGWKEMPDSVMSAGGRFRWDDAADAPNMIFSMMEHKGIPMTVEIRDLTISKDSKTQAAYMGLRGGNIIMCEKALIKISRGGGTAYTPDGKEKIKRYVGNGGLGHRENFIDAVKANDHGKLNAPIEGCHVSSAICHLSNISYRIGKTASPDLIRERMKDYEDIKITADQQIKQIKANDDDMSKLILGPKLTFDPKVEKFVGDDSAEANKLLRYEMRKEFAVPDRV
ncbi:MAG: gfo/Idh/MocA family oxidoreductase [Planctomycetes bacterium]|nr:gfo/Idh/MocA family oxidoreductase [Planctomycetota bacterium]